MIAAIRAAKTTATPSASCLTTLATVLATAVPTTKKAKKLKNAENHGAQRAGSARVATTVATELAASWKPLVKSNRSANTMTPTMATSNQSMETFLSALAIQVSASGDGLTMVFGLDLVTAMSCGPANASTARQGRTGRAISAATRRPPVPRSRIDTTACAGAVGALQPLGSGSTMAGCA